LPIPGGLFLVGWILGLITFYLLYCIELRPTLYRFKNALKEVKVDVEMARDVDMAWLDVALSDIDKALEVE
jgi:hypothetical protein